MRHDDAGPRQRATGMLLMMGSSASNQTGAALGATAFPVIGPVGVVAVRQLVTASLLVPLVRPPIRSLTAAQWRPVLALGMVFGIMNLSLYTAVDRIGLGLAVTLQFLGPLTIAVLSSRKVLDVLCAVLAGAGVVLLTSPGPTTDLLGIGSALIAATCWACYILLNRTLGQRLPGLQGTAVAAMVSATAWTPVAVVWFWNTPPTLLAAAAAVACGVLSSIVPYISDLNALRRVPAQMFGIFTSLNPAWAAVAGWVVLGQTLETHEWSGMALVITASMTVSLRSFMALRTPRRSSSGLPFKLSIHRGSSRGA